MDAHLNYSSQAAKNRSTSFDCHYRSQRACVKSIRNLRIERFKKLSSRSNSPDTIQSKSRLPFVRNKAISSANLVQQIRKFLSTENEWKLLKQNMLRSERDDVKNLTQKCYVSYQPNENSILIPRKALTLHDSNKLVKAIKDAKSCLASLKKSHGKQNSIHLKSKPLLLSESIKNFIKAAEELSPCKESSIMQPNESIRPLSFFDKRKNANKRVNHKENCNLLNSELTAGSTIRHRVKATFSCM
eukprot:TRINITY_DN12333_c0_g1_i1.p1 TRINITY_DN12333_c0_g1~~TRINITY_DN12333_c0_g1_i1.p1  ORF type:complete len:244 (+),score=30.22 TRINITY_DN12333_c0_g1_i1:139-870(+)